VSKPNVSNRRTKRNVREPTVRSCHNAVLGTELNSRSLIHVVIWMESNLVHSGLDFCNVHEILEVLEREIAHANRPDARLLLEQIR
jgi:hypothetical protein